MRVGAVVVTSNRSSILLETLACLDRQTRRVDVVLVVDNASTDGTIEAVQREFPADETMRLESNGGYALGLSAGMRHLVDRVDKLWLMDDDSHPSERALEVLLRHADRDGSPSLVGLGQRASLILGVPQWKPTASGYQGTAESVDAVLLDNSLIDTTLVSRVGTPRENFFMMFEDVEYCCSVFDTLVMGTIRQDARSVDPRRAGEVIRASLSTDYSIAGSTPAMSPVSESGDHLPYRTARASGSKG